MSDQTLWTIVADDGRSADLVDTYEAPLLLGDVVWHVGDGDQRWPLFHPSEADPVGGYRPQPYAIEFFHAAEPRGATRLTLTARDGGELRRVDRIEAIRRLDRFHTTTGCGYRELVGPGDLRVRPRPEGGAATLTQPWYETRRGLPIRPSAGISAPLAFSPPLRPSAAPRFALKPRKGAAA